MASSWRRVLKVEKILKGSLGSIPSPLKFIYSEKATKFSKIFTLLLSYVVPVRGISILGEVRNVEISRVTQQLQCSKSHDFLDIFALAHSKINQIA